MSPLTRTALISGLMLGAASLPAMQAMALPTANAPMLQDITPATQVSQPALSGVYAQQADALKDAIRAVETKLSAKGEPVRVENGATLKPGMQGERVAQLREFLTWTGDVTQVSAAANMYDAPLEEGVKRFQQRHALTADGVAGANTIKAMQVPMRTRIAQVQATLERIQQDAQNASLQGKSIVVNVPGYQLQAMENGKPVLTSKVIVGRTDRATPIFTKTIERVSFNPQWYVPQSIAKKDLLKKEHANPGYLARNNFKVVTPEGTVSPSEISWENISASDFNYRLRQGAGDDNALGKVKFDMESAQAIFLHSTSSPQLFAKNQRNLSSGCVRVEKAEELAQFVLKDMPEWSASRASDAYQGNRTQAVEVNSVPVQMVYWPAFVDSNTGAVHIHPDIYGKNEARVAELLRDGDTKQYAAIN